MKLLGFTTEAEWIENFVEVLVPGRIFFFLQIFFQPF
jgi:hypothetical protein